MKTAVYIDGFNLYYGALKNTPYKWLNPEQLVLAVLPDLDLVSIKYFTAKVRSLPHNPEAPLRQKRYLQALNTLPKLEIIEGFFQTKPASMPLSAPPYKTVEVLKTEEKGSDVNLATHLLNDAHLNRFKQAVVISNDSDLVSAVRLTRKYAKKKVGVLLTPGNRGNAIAKAASFSKVIETEHLEQAQFSQLVVTSSGKRYSKPNSW